jgi:hypothetical protein
MKEREMMTMQNKSNQLLPRNPFDSQNVYQLYFISGSSPTQQPTSELPVGLVVEVAGSPQVMRQISPECDVARLRVRPQCGDPLDATSERELLNKLLEGDLAEVCRYAVADDAHL